MCSSGGFAISSTQVDRRIKSIAKVGMYDPYRNIFNGDMDKYE